MSFGTLFVVYKGGRLEVVEIEKPTVDLGSADENDVVIKDEAVEPFHAQVLCDDSGCQLLDLASVSGTLLAGVRLTPDLPEPLADNAVFQIGGVTITYCLPVPEEQLSPTPVVTSPPPPRRGLVYAAAGLITLLVLALGAMPYRSRFTSAPAASATPSATTAPVATPTAVPTAVITPSPVREPTAAATPSPRGATPTPSALPSPEQARLYVVTTSGNQRLNLRNAPAQNAPLVGQLASGAVVRALEGPVPADGLNWLRVESEGLSGWCVQTALRER